MTPEEGLLVGGSLWLSTSFAVAARTGYPARLEFGFRWAGWAVAYCYRETVECVLDVVAADWNLDRHRRRTVSELRAEERRLLDEAARVRFETAEVRDSMARRARSLLDEAERIQELHRTTITSEEYLRRRRGRTLDARDYVPPRATRVRPPVGGSGQAKG